MANGDSHSVYMSVKFRSIECGECGITFLVPNEKFEKLITGPSSFYCPNGHGRRINSPFKDENEKLKKENRALKIQSSDLLAKMNAKTLSCTFSKEQYDADVKEKNAQIKKH